MARIKVKGVDNDQEILTQASQGWINHVKEVSLQIFSCKTKE
jgi:hypothetical protein